MHRNKQAGNAIKERGQDDLFEALKRFEREVLCGRTVLESANCRRDKEIPRDHKKDLVGPAAQQVDKAERAGVWEDSELRIFR